MTPEHFLNFAELDKKTIPLSREILADLDTPLSTYLKLAEGPYSYLLESVQGGEKWGRFSIIGLPCRTLIKVYGKRVDIERNGTLHESFEVDNPLDWIDAVQALSCRRTAVEGLPKFTGGLVGYFGYDTVRYIEPRLGEADKPDALKTPDILLMVSDEVVVFDNLAGKLYLVVHVDQDGRQAGEQRLSELEFDLRNKSPRYTPALSTAVVNESDFVSGFTEDGYRKAVEIARRYITDGDIMQVVLSQRLSIPFQARPLDLYRALRSLNPSPYMYYLDLDGFQIVGSSPEILVRLEDNTITVRPIAGTRRRGKTEADDIAMEQELLADPKELAEHLMLIDLGRNDAGRVSKTGSVQVTEEMQVERYSHVMHIVSNVTGELRDKLSAIDVLRATFPAGTVSGAPKIRAMEIIDELEPVKRGIYSGAVGYLSWTGNMDTAIAIRTAVIQNGELHIQAGAGIVYDSVPQLEWKETMNKGRAIFKAVSLAEAGLDGKHR
ncbi:MAG: anthranilate synthase component I [Gammaproteobacteria bacterium]|nr:anthranilate synthase component I [Gammaproteobacteria bacterium]